VPKPSPAQAVVDDPRPEPPQQPGLDDCCRSGCEPCVFDLYEDALDRYRVALAAWELRHPQPDAQQSKPKRKKG
jgi:hypothetical protein